MSNEIPLGTAVGEPRVSVSPETASQPRTQALIGVPKETAAGEKRVATVPEVVAKLVKLGFSVAVESGAGDAASFSDDAYRAVGAEVLPSAAAFL